MLKKDLGETTERTDISTLNTTNTQPSKAVFAKEKAKMGNRTDTIDSIT